MVVSIVVLVLIMFLWIVEVGVGRLKVGVILLVYRIRSRFLHLGVRFDYLIG